MFKAYAKLVLLSFNDHFNAASSDLMEIVRGATKKSMKVHVIHHEYFKNAMLHHEETHGVFSAGGAKHEVKTRW